MPRVLGILETALYCDELNVTAAFYRKVFAFPTLLDSPRLIALDVSGRSVLLLFQKGATDEPYVVPGGTLPGHGGSGPTHFAFAIAAEDVGTWRTTLRDRGVALESEVSWPGGAKSLYFRDPDNHAVELISPGFWSTF